MAKIFGYIITYKTKDACSRTNFHHTLFGRILYRKYRKKQYAYYIPGMLDRTPFIRLMNTRIFIKNLDDIDFNEISIFSDIDIKEVERNIDLNSLKTGEEYWLSVAKEKGVETYIKRKKHGIRKKR